MKHEPVVLVLGIGQSRQTAAWIKQRAEWLAKVVPPINFLAFRSTSDATEAATLHLKHELKSMAAQKYVLIAESQAAPLVVGTILSGDIPQPSQLVLLQPLGLNPDALGGTKVERYRSLMQRSRKFWAHKNQSLKEWGNRATFINLLVQTAPYAQRIKRAYTFGANQSIVKSLVRLAKTVPVHIYAATEDSLFPYGEIQEALSSARGVVMHEISETHLNRATRRGIDQLNYIKQELIGETS